VNEQKEELKEDTKGNIGYIMLSPAIFLRPSLAGRYPIHRNTLKD